MLPRSLLSVILKFRSITLNNVHVPNSLVPWISNQQNVKNFSNITISKLHHRNSVSNEKSGFDQLKANIVLSLNFKSPEDALPFYKLPIRTLKIIQKTTQKDKHNNYCENRLYYIASRIKVPPHLLSEKLAKRTFIYTLSFEWIEKSLNVLIEMDVSGDRILRDLWVLKYHHETICERLERVRSMGVDNLYPWMVRCSEDILNRSISISRETKNILGEGKTTQSYLADRLNTSVETVQEMTMKMPALRTIRATKVKHFLDFLLNEGFAVEDITSKPRILSASPKTVKQRLDKLRQMGLSKINLNVLCRSRKNFNKFCHSLESASEESTKR